MERIAATSVDHPFMESGTHFDQYEILHRGDGSLWELGRGAMGVTYAATDTELQRRVVLKVIHPGILGKEEVLERFQREARAAAALRHPNIANVYRLGRAADGTDYYAMEYCEGATLQDAVDSHGPLPVAQSLRLTLQVAKALIVAGEQRVVHRDLKPSNLILTERPDEGAVVKVIDFGLAKTVVDGPAGFVSQGSGFSGTLQYASPEQLAEGVVDHRADIYALGGCLWFMLTGHPPFAGSLAAVINQKMTTDLAWERIAQVPLAVHDLLRRMMAKDPADRHQTASELRQELEACLADCAEAAVPPPLLGVPAGQRRPGSSLSQQTAPPYADRFELGEVLWQDGLGTVSRVIDRTHPSARLALRQLDCSLTAVPLVRRTLEDRLESARLRTHPNLLQVRDFGMHDGRLGFVFPWADGISLRQLLTRVDVLDVADVHRLLKPLAAASDCAEQHHLEGFDLVPEQILLHFPAGLREDQKARYLAAPLADWPEFELLTSCLTGGLFAPVGAASIGPGSGALSLASSANLNAANSGPVPLARFAAEILGCAQDRSGQWQRGNALDAASFAVLSRALNPAGQAPFATCAAFVAALENAGKISLSAPLPAPPKLEPLPAPPPLAAAVQSGNSPASALWAAIAAVVLLGGGGAGYYFGVYRPNHRKADLVHEQPPGNPAENPPNPPAEPPKQETPAHPEIKPPAQPPHDLPPPTDPPTDPPATPPAKDPKGTKTEVPATEPPVKPPEETRTPPVDPEALARKREDAVRQQLNELYVKNEYEAGFTLLQESAEVFPGHAAWNSLADKLADLAAQAMQKGARLDRKIMEQAAFWAQRKVPAALELNGLLLARNREGPEALAEAYQNFAAAAAAGRKHARFLQAECLALGKGTPRDIPQAKTLLEESVKEGFAPGMNQLGDILYKEKGAANFRRAAELFQQAADAGLPDAIRNLGVLYINGDGVKQDRKLGAEFFLKAAEKGDIDAMLNYATCLENAIGVPKNLQEAQSWKRKAAEAVKDAAPANHAP